MEDQGKQRCGESPWRRKDTGFFCQQYCYTLCSEVRHRSPELRQPLTGDSARGVLRELRLFLSIPGLSPHDMW